VATLAVASPETATARVAATNCLLKTDLTLFISSYSNKIG